MMVLGLLIYLSCVCLVSHSFPFLLVSFFFIFTGMVSGSNCVTMMSFLLVITEIQAGVFNPLLCTRVLFP